MSCIDTIQAYGLRSIGIGERLLPKSDFTLCQQFTLIGSGMLWNIFFGVLALLAGYFFANFLALAKGSDNPLIKKPAEWFIFVFRGSPLFIQFFLAYYLFLAMKQNVDQFAFLTSAWAGATVVLFLNTSAYSAEIFYGAYRNIPKGDIEAAKAYGLSGWPLYKRIIWPTKMRLAWASYTNEAIFLFHATTLVFFSGFPAWQQKGDALYYANYFADKTFDPFVPYPILAGYFILLTLILLWFFRCINRRFQRGMEFT